MIHKANRAPKECTHLDSSSLQVLDHLTKKSLHVLTTHHNNNHVSIQLLKQPLKQPNNRLSPISGISRATNTQLRQSVITIKEIQATRNNNPIFSTFGRRVGSNGTIHGHPRAHGETEKHAQTGTYIWQSYCFWKCASCTRESLR